ncbi:unnamed protein product [Thelazia callipaeda]|uniref:L antigen family member 3 n=1 Tax=Thelazia callipaeda TaxID=103827 RepID=A0A0N5D852_THECL|nr:unnamed protein product [Thelazia callipaeda]
MQETEDYSDNSSVGSALDCKNTVSESHKATLCIDLGDEQQARMICKTLSVDEEPSRSTAVRTYSVQGHHLIVNIASSDVKYLQKSIDNLFDMCWLARQTIEQVTQYRLKIRDDANEYSKKKSGMFKGLKSKLEDEAKKLQATVSQYGENLAQQVRSGMSETGNDASGHTRHLFSSSSTLRNSLTPSPNLYSDESERGYDSSKPQNPNSSAMMQEVPEQDLLSWSRKRSNSIESESSLGNLFSAMPGMLNFGHRLNTITSDIESESAATSSQFQSASKEQISTVLHKLQGRAANYKDKYRKLVHMYNDLVRDSEKYQARLFISVLATTQDKALNRIESLRQKNRELMEKIQEYELDTEKGEAPRKEVQEKGKVAKLQEMLEKCHINIKENEERISQLTEENQKLKKSLETSYGEQGISDLAVQRMSAEWKSRMDCLNEEWTERLRNCEEAHVEFFSGTLAIAKVKAEMHKALDEKDIELQAARAKSKMLETNGLEVLKHIDELKATVDALENEKADMVEKLSEAKQQGVKAVRCEEEEKREELIKEMEKKRATEREEDERRFQELIKTNVYLVYFTTILKDAFWASKFREQEEQMQLAIEEREMQKVAAVMEHDRRNDDLGLQVEKLTAEKLHLQSVLDNMKERHRQQMDELCVSIEANKERHQQTCIKMTKKQEQLVASLQKDLELTTESNKLLKEQFEEFKRSKAERAKEFEDRNGELLADLTQKQKILDQIEEKHKTEVDTLHESISAMKESHEEILSENIIMKEKLTKTSLELQEWEKKIIELNQRFSIREKEVKELNEILEQKAATIMNLESEKEILRSELASTREFSKIHQHLQFCCLKEQLTVAEMERDEAERKYSEMEEKVQKAMLELEEDRRILQQGKQELEEKELRNNQWGGKEMTEKEAHIVKQKMDQVEYQAQKAKNDLNEKVALLIAESEKLKSQVEDQQEQIEGLEEEKQMLTDKLQHIKKKVFLTSKEQGVELSNSESTTCVEENEMPNEFPPRAENKLSLLAEIEELETNMCMVIKQKKNVIQELENIRSSRDNLKMKIAEVEENFHEISSKKNLEIEKLKTQLIDREGVVDELQKKINERRSNDDAELHSLKMTLNEERKRQEVLESELIEMTKKLDKLTTELKQSKENNECLQNELGSIKKKREEEQKIRDQYATLLKNANDSFEAAQKELANLDLIRTEKDRLVAELSSTKNDCEKIVLQLKHVTDNELRIEEMNKKAEQKMLKVKKQYEADGNAAKAELLLEIDEMRSQLAERDLMIEEQKLNVNALEKKLLDEEQNTKIINELQASIRAVSAEKDLKLIECSEMNNELNLLRTSLDEMRNQLTCQKNQIDSMQQKLDSSAAENIHLKGLFEV